MSQRSLWEVAAVGCIGGALAWAFSLWLRHPPHVGLYADPFLSTALGAGAGMVFVFLIANTDRTDRPRLMTLALLAGFFWEPVWEGGRALVDRQGEQNRIEEAKRRTDRAIELAKSLESATGSARDTLIAQLNDEVTQVSALATQVQTVNGITAINSSTRRLREELRDSPAESRALLAAVADEPPAILRSVPLLPTSLARITASTSEGVVLRPRKLTEGEVPSSPSAVSIGSSTTSPGGEKVVWFSVAIEESRSLTISATSEQDLLLALYDRDSLILAGEDDDSGGDFNPRLNVNVESGEYLIRISAYDQMPVHKFELSVASAQQRR